MSKNFYEFSQKKVYERPSQNKNTYSQKHHTSSENLKQKNTNFSNINPEMAEAVNKYSKMSQNELMQNLLQEVNKQKQNGTFDAGRLEGAVDGLSGILSGEQMRNIKEIIKSLK